MIIGVDDHGEIGFGTTRAGPDLEYGPSTVFFPSVGFDEMDEVGGAGSPELQDDGTVEIEIAYHLRDEVVLKAERATSSTACYLNSVASPMERPAAG